MLIEHLPGKDNLVFVENSKTAELQRQDLSAQDVTKIFAQKVLPVFEIVFFIFYSMCAFIINYWI